MNASSWRKAVDLVVQGTQANQQVQAAATADTSHLESLPLSALLLWPTAGELWYRTTHRRKYTKGNVDINTRNTNY